MSPTLTLLYLTCSIFISSVIAYYAWQHRTARGCRSFTVLILVTILWIFGDIVARLNDNYTGQFIGEAIRYLGGNFLPPALLVFVYQYCGRPLRARTVGLLLVVPVLSWLMLITNDFHHLFFRVTEIGFPNSLHVTFGYYFWIVHLPFSYGVMLASFVKITAEVSRVSKYYRMPIITLFIAILIPFAINILGIVGLFGRASYSPMSFPVAFILIAVAIYRFNLLRNSPIAYETMFQTIKDGVLIVDNDDIIRDINTAGAERLKAAPDDVLGLNISEALAQAPDLLAIYEKQKRQLEDIDSTVADEERFLSLDITPLYDVDGSLRGRIVILRDVTDRKQYEISLAIMAFHDPLTRLANRRKFQEQVELAIQSADETGKDFAVLYFDLNRFKYVNDSLGHDVGDELLKYVAARSVSILRKPDMVARMGGDEFAVLLHNADERAVERVVERLLESVERPFHVGEHTLTVGLSIGAAFYPNDGQTLTQLLRHADTAMYHAKSQGGGLTLYSPGSEMEN